MTLHLTRDEADRLTADGRVVLFRPGTTMMGDVIERRAIRSDADDRLNPVSLPPPPAESLPVSTVEPVLLRAMQRVRSCPAGCGCRGTKPYAPVHTNPNTNQTQEVNQ